jgi:hypothetical protein
MRKKISAYGIKVSIIFSKLKPPRGSQDKYILEMLVKGFGMSKKELVRFNRVHKHQQTTFLSDLAMTKGDTITKLLMSDWRKTHDWVTWEE